MADAATVLDVKTSIDDVGTGIRKEKRKEIASRLSEVLTGSYILVLKSHLYHWNEVGPLFHSLHKMTEDHYEKIFEACDEIAERIRALGYPASLSAKLVQRRYPRAHPRRRHLAAHDRGARRRSRGPCAAPCARSPRWR